MIPCGCTAYRKYGVHDKIEYCPMHAAAREMLALLTAWLKAPSVFVDWEKDQRVADTRALLARIEGRAA